MQLVFPDSSPALRPCIFPCSLASCYQIYLAKWTQLKMVPNVQNSLACTVVSRAKAVVCVTFLLDWHLEPSMSFVRCLSSLFSSQQIGHPAITGGLWGSEGTIQNKKCSSMLFACLDSINGDWSPNEIVYSSCLSQLSWALLLLSQTELQMGTRKKWGRSLSYSIFLYNHF